MLGSLFKATVVVYLLAIILLCVNLYVVARDIQADTHRCAESLEAIQAAVDRLP